MSPTPNLLALADNVVINLAYLQSAVRKDGNLVVFYHNQSTEEAPDPDGALFARLRERAWPLLEKP